MQFFEITSDEPTDDQPTGRIRAFLQRPTVKATGQTLMLLAVAVAGTAITDLPLFS